MQLKSSQVPFDGKPLFNGQLKKGASVNDALCIIEKLMDVLFKGVSVTDIDLVALGIQNPDPDKTPLQILIDYLLTLTALNSKQLATLLANVNTVQTNVGTFADEKVKIAKTGTAGYLQDLFTPPPNSIKFENDKVLFYGLVPVGFRGTINPARINDMDGTGKGKAGTDLWGWALRNGKNGLDNAMGLFPMYADLLANAGQIAGAASFTVAKANISTFALAITGTITEALEDNVTFKVNLGARHKCFGVGGCRDVLVPEDGADKIAVSEPKNFKHSHGFNLSSTHTNPAPTPIDLIPRHIKEIPIERIIV